MALDQDIMLEKRNKLSERIFEGNNLMFVTPYHVFEVLSCKHKMNEREILVTCMCWCISAGRNEREKKERVLFCGFRNKLGIFRSLRPSGSHIDFARGIDCQEPGFKLQ